MPPPPLASLLSAWPFLLIFAGGLLLYCEAIWIGKIVYGIAGAGLLLTGLAAQWKLPHTTLGLCLLAGATLCFALESTLRTGFLAALSGTALLAWGLWKLCPAPFTIAPQLAFPFSAVFGITTTALLFIAKQARQNKRVDL